MPRRRRSRSRPTPDDVAAGRVAGTFGVRGELKCDATRAARSLFVAGARFRYEGPASSGELCVTSVRTHGQRMLLTIEGVRDRDAAQAYAGAMLYAAKGSIPLEDGEYLDADLVGCAVVDLQGREYGEVRRVEHFPASDMLVVESGMIPMVDAIVRSIDVRERRVTIDPPEGLL